MGIPITPDFLIAGAPKCGTTALNDFLSQHPDCNLIEKELHFFGNDLKLKKNRRSEEDYFSRFKKGKLNGDASVWYLYSDSIFDELKAYGIQPKIIIMLRNPVDFIYSLHSQNLFDANEDQKDFETALYLEAQRKNGGKIPDSNNNVKSLAYKEVAHFSERIKKFLAHFPKENIFVGLQEDLKNNPQQLLKNVEEFLGLAYYNGYNFRQVNANKEIKNLALHSSIKSPNKFKKGLIKLLIPSKKARQRIADKIYNSNFKESKRSELPENLRESLSKEFKDEIEQLSQLIGRDLSHWK